MFFSKLWWKICEKIKRGVSAPHHGNRLRFQPDSHCPESNSLRGFFVYTSGSVLLTETRTHQVRTGTLVSTARSDTHFAAFWALSPPLTRAPIRTFIPHLAGCLMPINSKADLSRVKRSVNIPDCFINRAITSCWG